MLQATDFRQYCFVSYFWLPACEYGPISSDVFVYLAYCPVCRLGLGLGARWKWVGRGFLSLDGG